MVESKPLRMCGMICAVNEFVEARERLPSGSLTSMNDIAGQLIDLV